MKASNRVRPSLEGLEQRWCPAVTARVDGGNLIVSGAATNAADTIKITQTGANAFKVEDGATLVGNLTGVTKDVRVNLGSANDLVALDLGGNTAPRNVTVNLGRGDNRLAVSGAGTVTGHFSVFGGRGADTVVLGDGTNNLQFNREVSVNLDGNATDALTVANKVTVKGSLATTFVNNVTLAVGSVVEKNVGIVGGSAGNTVVVNGEIDGHFGFSGGSGVDSVTLTNNVGKNAALATFGGADAVAVGGTVTGHLHINSGGGNDAVTISGTIGRTTTVFTESGDDTLAMTATAQFQGNAVISMGGGADRATLDDAASITTMLLNGGSASDTYVGNRTRPGLTLVSF